jgi:hypothetical protein
MFLAGTLPVFFGILNFLESWKTSGGFIKDKNAFLFSLVTPKREKTIKMNLCNDQSAEYAILYAEDKGPCFGSVRSWKFKFFLRRTCIVWTTEFLLILDILLNALKNLECVDNFLQKSQNWKFLLKILNKISLVNYFPSNQGKCSLHTAATLSWTILKK